MKKLLTPLLFLCISFSLFSQKSEDKAQRIKTLKVAFITERLNLSEKEAQQFWPVYNTFDLEEDMLRKTAHEKRKQIKDDITEAKAKIILDDLIKFESEKLTLKLDYIDSLKTVISDKKIILLKLAEEDFRRKMFEEYKNRHKEDKKSN
ncbi:sensor of ECF-type sigma factor [Lacinutrix undariae]